MDGDLSQKTDEELAFLVQGNNNDAFGVLMDRYQPKLLRYGRKFLTRDEHIEDAVQDIFIKTYKNMKGYDAARKFSPWIYRIAHNAFVNTLRDRSRDPVTYFDLDALVVHPSYEFDPAEEEDKKRMTELVSRGLQSLTPSYREVLILYYLEDLSYQEIADVLHIPTGTVGVRLRRAKEVLKKQLGGEWSGEQII